MEKLEPQFTQMHVFSTQICVPEDYTNEQALEFVEKEYPAGTSAGWQISDKVEQRVKCEKREGCVHILVIV
jgi:flagellar biosynthesis/type III secretory pathway M-ring protein FliF/YscJ